MIDHTGLIVNNFTKSKAWYRAALKPIGYDVLMEFNKSMPNMTTDVAGFGEQKICKPDFWIMGATSSKAVNNPPLHIAFRAQNREQVDQFYASAIATGGTDNGKPGLRAYYHPDYYSAFVFDLDGHNIEVVCHDKP